MDVCVSLLSVLEGAVLTYLSQLIRTHSFFGFGGAGSQSAGFAGNAQICANG